LFVLSAAGLVLNTMITQPLRAAAGLGVVLLGTPAYFVWRARSRRREALGVPITVEK
jgi:APA family basic amino acid/polyamine antiporter